jgi:hypothetical protein
MMDGRRFDDLLEDALTTREAPAGVSPAEAAEIASLTRGADAIRDVAPAIRDEAHEALPVARARFERFVAANRPLPAPPAPVRRQSRWAWLRGGGGRFALAGSLAGVALLVAVVAGVALSGGGVETAAAQVLTPGDYAQVEGVVTATTGEGDGQVVTIESHLGPVQVALGDSVDRAPAVGARLTVAGLVERAGSGDALRIAASSVSAEASGGQAPAAEKPRELNELRRGLVGTVVVFTLGPNGQRGAVVLETAGGERLCARLGQESVALLAGLPDPIGTEVRVVRKTGLGFEIELAQGTPPPASATPPAGDAGTGETVRILGIPVGIDGRVVTLRTLSGPTQAVIRPATVIVVGRTGVTAEAIRRGEFPAGIALAISGTRDAQGRIVADIIVVERRATLR